MGHKKTMVRTYQTLCMMLCLAGLARAQDGAPAKIELSADRYLFDNADAPITLCLKFINITTNDIALCPNRIECQNTFKTVVNKSDKPLAVATNWNMIDQHLPNYFHGDEEQYVVLKPNESYVLKEQYFAEKDMNLKNLLAFSGPPWPPLDGKYIVRIFFDGKECSVLDAPPEVKSKLVKERIISSEISITLKRK